MPDFVESHDFLNNSTILRRASVNRQHFDPANAEHIESLKAFIRTGNWGTVQFYCEFPFTDVPMTVLMKYTSYLLNVKRMTTGELIEARSLTSIEEASIAR